MNTLIQFLNELRKLAIRTGRQAGPTGAWAHDACRIEAGPGATAGGLFSPFVGIRYVTTIGTPIHAHVATLAVPS